MERTLLSALAGKVQSGQSVFIDIPRRTIKCNNRIIYSIKDGHLIRYSKPRKGKAYTWSKSSLPVGVIRADTSDDCFRVLIGLYSCFKHSRTSAESDRRDRNSYFEALPTSELSESDILYGAPREECRFLLDFHVMCYAALGILKWDEEKMGKWFWKCPTDPDFVILRQWIEP